MSINPVTQYPGKVAPATPDNPFGTARNITIPGDGTGTPWESALLKDEWGLQHAMLINAGMEPNGTPDSAENSQLFKAAKASIGNGANLLSNHNFLIASPDDSQPPPDATPRSYPPGFQIFSGVFTNETTGILNLTYIDGRLSFSGGDFYMAVPNTGALENITEFVASVADFDGKPRTRGVSYALVGDEYRVTVGVDALEDASAALTPLGSVKFEQGGAATGHEVGSLSIGNLSDYTDVLIKNDTSKSAVDNMVEKFATNPLAYALGTIFKTGGTTWQYKDSTGPITINNFRIFNAINIFDCGSTGNIADDSTDAFLQASAISDSTGAEIFLPPGKFSITKEIDIPESIWGSGSESVMRPQGQHGVFNIKTGESGKGQSGRVGNFVIDYQSVGAINSDCVALWLSKGGDPTSQSGNNNILFSSIYVFGAYRGINKLSTDTGNLWNVRFENVLIFNSEDWGMYIDTTNANGSLNVSFDTVTCDGFDSTTAKGAFIRGIANLDFNGISTANTGANLSAFWASDCTNVTVKLQIENIDVTSEITQGLVGFTNCPTVRIELTSQTCDFNQPAGDDASYIYTDSNVKNFYLDNFSPNADTFGPGNTYKLNVFGGVSVDTILSITDPRVEIDDIFSAKSVLSQSRIASTSYALEKDSSTRRVKNHGIVSPVNTVTDLISTLEYDGIPFKPSGLYLVQGRFSGDSNIGFTDLVMIASTGTSLQKTKVVDSDFFGANHVRTYSINNNNLAISIAHTSGNYTINATGVDQAGA